MNAPRDDAPVDDVDRPTMWTRYAWDCPDCGLDHVTEYAEGDLSCDDCPWTGQAGDVQ